MRIKILGDCYYCVAGVPDEDEDHAHHTVQMGLDMIELIQVWDLSSYNQNECTGIKINLKVIERKIMKIIYFLQDVRNEHKVDVNMRIGVHSGYILSGIIGN